MAKPKKKRGLPKTTGEWEALTDEQVAQKVFGRRGQEALKTEAQKSAKPKRDYRLPT